MNNGDDKPITTGSGFFVTEDTIVTNYHVVRNAVLGAVKVYGGDEVYSIIGTVGVDPKNDVALLKIKGVKGKPLKLNGTSQLSIGDEIFTVSSPKGLEGTFSQGLISSLRKTSREDLIQISAAISHGSSGGAILNNQAEVIAVAVGGIDEGQSLNFAVPIKYVQNLMAKKDLLAELPGKINISNSNNSIISGIGSGSGKTVDTATENGSDLGSLGKSTTATTNELAIKAPSTVTELLKLRVASPTLKPDQFKIPSLDDDFNGDVFSVLETSYETVPNFDKFKKGKKSYDSLMYFNPEGNVTSNKSINYENDNRSETKEIASYDSANRTVKVESYSDGSLQSKTITVYNYKGEIASSNEYDEKGNLTTKATSEYSNQFEKRSICSADNDCKIIYEGLDENGIETVISYKNSNLYLIVTNDERVKGSTKKIIYNFCHGGGFDENDEELPCTYNGKISKITDGIGYYDPQTKYIISISQATRDLDNPNKPVEKESYKYEYKYDLKGNWIEKIEKKKVTKFGETYFEPISITEREIRYFSDPDTKPSTKSANVKRKKS